MIHETSAKLFIQFAFLKYFSYLYRMKQKLSSPSFADLFLGQRKVKQTFFSQINTSHWLGTYSCYETSAKFFLHSKATIDNQWVIFM